MHSKNDVFSTDWSTRPPPPIKLVQPPRDKDVLKTSDASLRTVPVASPVIDAPTTAANPSLEVRLLSNFELGSGRHSTVYLAFYREHSEREPSPFNVSSSSSSSWKKYSTWKICAAKRFAAGKDAQVACLSEALMLTRLAKCPQVVRYVGLKDERPLSRPSSSRTNSSAVSSDVQPEILDNENGASLDTRRPPSLQRFQSNTTTSVSTPSSPALRATPVDSSLPTLLTLQQRQQEESKASLRRNATVKASKSPPQLPHARRRPLQISTRDGIDDGPRMLLLTEYCPLGNLAIFVLQHGEHVLGRKMFFKFAIDLMKALVATHEKNIIHGDVKPQNCLIDGSFNLKLGDFSSSLFNSPDLDDGIGLGTTQYSSPEVVQMPPSPFSFPIDIFSAGLTLLFMITGVQPYESLTMPSTNRSDRFTPKSPRSPRGSSGNVTPTGNMSYKRKYRTSSGAGKMVELHVHLSKGHAWEWEERRRLQELEDNFIRQETSQCQSPKTSPALSDPVIPLAPIDAAQAFLEPAEDHVEELPDRTAIPPELIDSLEYSKPIRSMQTYSDGYTPIQLFLYGGGIVPEGIRGLIKQMLEPNPSERPSAAAVLQRLESLRCEEQ